MEMLPTTHPRDLVGMRILILLDSSTMLVVFTLDDKRCANFARQAEKKRMRELCGSFLQEDWSGAAKESRKLCVGIMPHDDPPLVTDARDARCCCAGTLDMLHRAQLRLGLHIERVAWMSQTGCP